MAKTKQDYINELVSVAFDFDKKYQLQEQRSKDLQEMASLARQGKKESQEFRRLEMKHRATVIDFSEESNAMRRIIKSLKKYAWNF